MSLLLLFAGAGVGIVIEPNVIEGFGSYEAQVEAFASHEDVDAFGIHESTVPGFGSQGEV